MKAKTLQQPSASTAILLTTIIALAIFAGSCGGGATPAVPASPPNPPMSLSPVSLSFGSQPVESSSSPQSVTLTNSGTGALTISSITAGGDFMQTNNCGTSVAAGSSCTISVVFTATAIGTRSGTLTISDDAAGSPQTVPLSGSGTHDVILAWTESATPGVMGYDLYRGTTSGGESSTPLNSTPINGTTYTDANVTAGAAYYYVVTAVASDGVTQSADSNEVSATVPST
jgi:hypothetical protein